MRIERDNVEKVRRPLTEVPISDLTASHLLSWHDEYDDLGTSATVLVFDVEPTPAEQNRLIIRMLTTNSVEEELMLRCQQALAANRAWLDAPHPQSITDIHNYLDTVSRELTGLIRIVLRWLDTTD